MRRTLGFLTIAFVTLFTLVVLLAYVDRAAARTPDESNLPTIEAANRHRVQPSSRLPAAPGNLSVTKYAVAGWSGLPPGYPISYTIFYGWNGEGPAPDVQVTDVLPPQVTISTTQPPPDSQNGGTLVWNLGTLDNFSFGTIVITGALRSDLTPGTIFTNTVTITGSVTDEDPLDNSAQVGVEVVPPQPDFWLLKWGLFEELEQGFVFVAEQGVETTFDLLYINFSGFGAQGVTLVDELPSGVEYVSADPAPSVDGQQLTWDLGAVPAFGFGEVSLRLRPVQTGTLVNTATISSTLGDRDAADNTSEFQFQVVPLLPPRLLKPNVQDSSSDRPIVVGSNATFEGLAKAGATVTLYEGSGAGCFGDFAACNPTPLVSTTAGLDRSWVMTPTTMTETRTYSLYLRAELAPYVSEPPYGYWTPFFLRVDPLFEQSGWDMDNFVIETDQQESHPGGLGGSSGTTPDEPFTIKIRQDLWDTVPTSPTLRANHDLRLVITESSSDPYTVTLPVTEFQRVPTATQATDLSHLDPTSPLGGWAYDMFYVQHGFGPGAHVEVWCRPVYYPDDPDEIPIVGLVWTLCHEILIDPAGYVYDLTKAGTQYDWPEVPPSDSLITNATVTATVRAGDDSWTRWEAEKTGQVNPQVTDYSTPDGIKVPGYYAFYVPPGQYRVGATAQGCVPYGSPILTVIDAPIFHNVGMRCTDEAQTGVRYDLFLPLLLR
jgi:hypothetical protein